MLNPNLDKFNSSEILLIFSYSPAGLGHLRVTNALSHGLPHGGSKILLGSRDNKITFLHRLTSISPSGRKLGDWFQQGKGEKVFTQIYRFMLQKSTTQVYHQLLTLIDSRIEKPKIVIIVATHFSLAHQFAVVKKRLEKERGVKVYLVVQVTDDSPQAIWYVPGADLIFVPSKYTKEVLLDYGKKSRLAHSDIFVNPYPVSPLLSEDISKDRLEQRISQLDPVSASKTNICLPVSGAAVGLEFDTNLIEKLHQISDRYNFHIISKKVPFTSRFLESMKNKTYVNTYTSFSDRELVTMYDRVYKQNIISLEITKPSEQAFKALLKPSQLGGSLLLFTDPVGRQEHDNLHFLAKHGLIPHSEENENIWKCVSEGKNTHDEVIYELRNFRGLTLPYGSGMCADFINKCLNNKIFYNMTLADKSRLYKNEETDELGSDGVKRFWEKIAVKFLNFS
jgi:hypothetical protein